ncbi:SPOR domain-containing protein [Marinilabiliaceae bacterium ANBcel2]|nr:SPOR domain-containing protein [Marinilabiliaceae bacterium ANBcel2]
MMRIVSKMILLLFCFMFIGESYADKLEHLRSTRKITTEAELSAPWYTIQIVALRESPQNPQFFRDFQNVREFNCTDGYVRYTVGKYNSFSDAADELSKYKQRGFDDVFVLNLQRISLVDNNYTSTPDSYKPSSGKDYTIQVAAYRFPVYLTEFDQFDEVYEFRMDDNIFRYTVGRFDGTDAIDELKNLRQSGYPEAYLVPFDDYAPYRIE